MAIHPTALVDPKASIAETAVIGPYCVVGPDVEMGAGTRLMAQVYVDGFVTRDELFEMMRLGAVGEVTGWAYDAKGHLLKGGTNKRLTSIPPQAPAQTTTIAAAIGQAKVVSICAALAGGLINGLITDEATARTILDR